MTVAGPSSSRGSADPLRGPACWGRQARCQELDEQGWDGDARDRSALGVDVRPGRGPDVFDQRPPVLDWFWGRHPWLDLLDAALSGWIRPASQETEDVGQQAMSHVRRDHAHLRILAVADVMLEGVGEVVPSIAQAFDHASGYSLRNWAGVSGWCRSCTAHRLAFGLMVGSSGRVLTSGPRTDSQLSLSMSVLR
jgi:hypothetical protein